MSTTIEYLDETINPVQDTRKGKSGRGYHCTKCSPGCQNCWAEAMNMRFGNGQPFDDTPVKFEIIEPELHKLRKWKKHRYVGIEFMGDLYHPDIDEWINSYIYGELYINPQHTYLLLTKRPELMQTFFLGRNIPPHIHGGLTICNQQEADEKIPIFLQIPFATHVLSIEPMLGPMDLTGIKVNEYQTMDSLSGNTYGIPPKISVINHHQNKINGVIAGGESGPGARPMHPDWVRSVRDQCVEAGVAFFFKQWGEWLPGDPRAWDESEKPTYWRYQDNSYGGFHRNARHYHRWEGGVSFVCVGKKKAGRLLDGRTWEERP